MISIELEDLNLYSILKKRGQKDRIAALLTGILVPMLGDAQEMLEYIRRSFPTYTGHNIQHSFRLLDRVAEVLPTNAKKDLSSIEIFCLITAAVFHDVGMAFDRDGLAEDRNSHHTRAKKIISEYMKTRLGIIEEYLPRLTNCICFLAEAHGLSWEDLKSRKHFKRPEKVSGQKLRCNILSILIRIGDLLDLDAERTCAAVRRFLPDQFSDSVTQTHHESHLHVEHFDYSPNLISITIVCESRDEHKLWTNWLNYLEKDILHANTYVFINHLAHFHLPHLEFDIKKSDGATYEVWSLRFDIDKKGRIWEVISQAIYTRRFDFIRELLQNSIDANLLWIYLNDKANCQTNSPRQWSLEKYTPSISLYYSEKSRILEVQDNGIGMNRDALKRFLFTVAETGYEKIGPRRDRPFPSIAKFGIGFVSILTRANQVAIETRHRTISGQPPKPGRHVTLDTESQEALSEKCSCEYGTLVRLHLKEAYSLKEIEDYIRTTFVYPSLPITLVNRDLLQSSGDGQAEETIRTKHRNRPSGLDGATFRIAARALVPTSEVKPYWFALNQEFQIIKCYRSDRLRRLSSPTCWIVWIPVQYVDFDIGIEWFSLHGFLIQDYCVVKGVGVDMTWADYYDDPDKGIAMGYIEDNVVGPEEAMLVLDLVDEFKLAKYRFSGKERIPRRRFNGLMEENNDFVLNINKKPESYFGTLSDRFSIPIDGTILKQHKEFIQFFNQLDNAVFQDGIRIPFDASSISRIGVTRCQVNLTASARFALNVTRNGIDESPDMMRNWQEYIGNIIQSKVITKIQKIIRKYMPTSS